VKYYCAECCTSTEDESDDKEALVIEKQSAYLVSQVTDGQTVCYEI
jgi:hypothetical protein